MSCTPVVGSGEPLNSMKFADKSLLVPRRKIVVVDPPPGLTVACKETMRPDKVGVAKVTVGAEPVWKLPIEEVFEPLSFLANRT
jgi:hypothetical protein